MFFEKVRKEKSKYLTIGKIILLLLLVYAFLVSISLMGEGMKIMGKEFTEKLLASTSNAFVGLFIGILTTSIVQSSSSTTSIVVGLVGAHMLNLQQAIPIIMGANIGTSITNTLVSLGYLGSKTELNRAYSAAVVHDIFNVLSVCIFLPLQITFNLIGSSATFLADIFEKSGGLHFVSPLKIIVKPVVKLLVSLFADNVWLIEIVALVILFVALRYIVILMKSMVIEKVNYFFDKVIFRTPLIGLFFATVVTAIVQSSSVTTSLIVPLAGAGLLKLEQVFPYTLGANVGTTITAIMASLVTEDKTAVAVAFAHLVFNIYGIIIFLPLKFIPISISKGLANLAMKNRAFPIIFVLFTFIIIPLIFIKLFG